VKQCAAGSGSDSHRSPERNGAGHSKKQLGRLAAPTPKMVKTSAKLHLPWPPPALQHSKIRAIRQVFDGTQGDTLSGIHAGFEMSVLGP